MKEETRQPENLNGIGLYRVLSVEGFGVVRVVGCGACALDFNVRHLLFGFLIRPKPRNSKPQAYIPEC